MKSRSSLDSKSRKSAGSRLGLGMPFGNPLGSRPRTPTGTGSGISSSELPKGSPQKPLKEFAKNVVDREIFVSKLMEWFLRRQGKLKSEKQFLFESPFLLDDLQDFDFALEGIGFQQLLRMPAELHLPATTARVEALLALEDFLQASVSCLWKKFWNEEGSIPLYVSCPYGLGSKFYTVEKAIARGRLAELCEAALVVKDGSTPGCGWAHVASLALLRDKVFERSSETNQMPSLKYIGEALFYAFYILLSRNMSKSTVLRHSKCAYVLVVDSHFGGVVRLRGDINSMNINIDRAYDCAIQWIQEHAEVTVSSFDQVWNRLGSANWGDVGILQLLLAIFYSLVECEGLPKKSISELAACHKRRLQKRRSERQFLEAKENGNDTAFRNQRVQSLPKTTTARKNEFQPVKLKPGTVLWLEDSHWQRGFQVHKIIDDSQGSFYSGSSLEEPGKLLSVYIGSHPSTWEDMHMWYQVQRQTKVLIMMKQLGITSKYLPQIVASGNIRHPGRCQREPPYNSCKHPWCGIPILVTYPIGISVSKIFARNGKFSKEEALKCCYHILSAIHCTADAGIHHGDVCPDNIIRMVNSDKHSYYVLVNWGHAVVEDKDRPAINFQFSSTYALQEGKLFPASDLESLVYVLYYLSGGSIPLPESVEAMLDWRESMWASRTIQKQLGDLSAVLKGFADYVDSLCDTPYTVDYKMWLKRLHRALSVKDNGKQVDHSFASTRKDDVAGSSGTSRSSFV